MNLYHKYTKYLKVNNEEKVNCVWDHPDHVTLFQYLCVCCAFSVNKVPTLFKKSFIVKQFLVLCFYLILLYLHG